VDGPSAAYPAAKVSRRGRRLRVHSGDSGGPAFANIQAPGVVRSGSNVVGDHYTVLYFGHIAQASDELNGWRVQTTP
jgi:hypothetical protein